MKDAKAAKRKVGRPATGINRPVLTFRVHETIHDRLKQSAERANISLSEAAEAWLVQLLEWEAAHGSMKKEWAEHQKALSGARESALRAWGYTPIHGVDGTLWASPGMDLTGKFTALHPTIVQAIEEAMLRVIKRERGE